MDPVNCFLPRWLCAGISCGKARCSWLWPLKSAGLPFLSPILATNEYNRGGKVTWLNAPWHVTQKPPWLARCEIPTIFRRSGGLPLENLITGDQCGLRRRVIGIIIEAALQGLRPTGTSTSLAVTLDGGGGWNCASWRRLRRTVFRQALPCGAESLWVAKGRLPSFLSADSLCGLLSFCLHPAYALAFCVMECFSQAENGNWSFPQQQP